ncbi:MAG: FAD binding domain-containing protein [Chloroflexi bacterium]|nr:FAD binding domain-containing protein [Chloroflexota bacterium]
MGETVRRLNDAREIEQSLQWLARHFDRPARPEFRDARTVDEAVSLLSKHGQGAKLLAGGIDLLGLMKNRVLMPAVVVNVKKIPGLHYITETPGGLALGALTRINDIERSPLVKTRYPILVEAAHSVASPQIRNMATLGGNLCQEVRCWYYRRPPDTGISFDCRRKSGDSPCYAIAGENQYHAIIGGNQSTMRRWRTMSDENVILSEDERSPDRIGRVEESFAALRTSSLEGVGTKDPSPAPSLCSGLRLRVTSSEQCFAVCPSDMATVLLALDAGIRTVDTGGGRLIPLGEFYTAFGNVLSPEEIVTAVEVPRVMPGARQRFIKFRLRKAIDFAMVSVASVVTEEDGVVIRARIVLGGVSPAPYRAVQAEEVLTGNKLTDDLAASAARSAVRDARPLSKNGYKVPMVETLVKRALLE